MNLLPDMVAIRLLVREITRALHGLSGAITANTDAMRALTQSLDDAAGTEIEDAEIVEEVYG